MLTSQKGPQAPIPLNSRMRSHPISRYQVPVFKYKQSQSFVPSLSLKSPNTCPDGPRQVGVSAPAPATCSTFTAYGQGMKAPLELVVFVLLDGYDLGIFVYR